MLAYDRESICLSHDVFDIVYDVRTHDREVPGIGANRFIFWDGDGDQARAIASTALAEDADVVL